MARARWLAADEPTRLLGLVRRFRSGQQMFALGLGAHELLAPPNPVAIQHAESSGARVTDSAGDRRNGFRRLP